MRRQMDCYLRMILHMILKTHMSTEIQGSMPASFMMECRFRSEQLKHFYLEDWIQGKVLYPLGMRQKQGIILENFVMIKSKVPIPSIRAILPIFLFDMLKCY